MSLSHILNELKNHFGDKPITVCELGILHGKGIPLLLDNFNIQNYYGIDLFTPYEENKKDGANNIMANNGDTIYNKLLNKYKKDNRIHIIKEFTNKAVDNFEDKFFDFIFVDAGHEYEQVSEDINLWYPKMKKNGIFSGDDFYFPPVQKAVYEFQDNTNLLLYNSLSVNNFAHPDNDTNDENNKFLLKYIPSKHLYKRNFTWYFKT